MTPQRLVRLAVTIGSLGAATSGCDATAPLRPNSSALDRGGNRPSLAAPTGTDAVPMLSDRVDIFWTDNSPDEDGFRVERSLNGGQTWTVAASVGASNGGRALVDEGRTPEQRVCYRVFAFNRKVTSPASNVDCTTPPAVPTGVTAAAAGPRAVLVSWRDNSAIEDGYYLTRWTADSLSTEKLIAEPPANASSFRDSTVNIGTAYSYRVRAKKDGGYGTPSAAAIAAPLPPPTPPVPAGTVVTPVSSTRLDLAWQASAATGVEIWRSTSAALARTLITQVAVAQTSYSDVALTPATEYCYELRAFTSVGASISYSAYTAPVCGTTLSPRQPLVPPSAASAVPVSSSSVRLAWTDNSASERGFRVQSATASGGPWSDVATLPANADTLLAYAVRERSACYRVIAFDDVGESAPSNVACTAPPAGPSGVVATIGDAHTVALSWTDNSTVEDSYRVSRKGIGDTWVDLATLPANATTYRDATFVNDVAFTYRIQAGRDGGYSDFSEEVTTLVPATRPAMPLNTGMSYTPDVEGFGWLYFDVWWTDASSNESGFRIEFSADGVNDWSTYAVVGANEQGFHEKLDIFYPAHTSGCVRVYAVNAIGESDPSVAACSETGVGPTNLTATPIDQQRIDLSWTDNARLERGFLVFRALMQEGPYDLVAQLAPNSTSFQDVGLAAGQQYWYLVVVFHDDYWGYDYTNYSDYASATTLPPGIMTQGTAVQLTLSPNASTVKRPARHLPLITSRPRRRPSISSHPNR